MTKHIQITLIFLCFLLYGNTQSISFEIEGFVSEFGDSTYMIDNTDIIIIKGKDTLTKIKTDKKGFYYWKGDFQEGDELLICARHKYYVSQETKLKVENINTLTILNFALMEFHYFYPEFPIYELNEIKIFSNFDVELLKHQLRKIKIYCIKFVQYQNPNESYKLGQKRIKKFKKLLVQNGFPAENLKFELNPIVMNCNEQTDCRSKIQGVVISLGEKCD